ncbi:receptor-like serine/threonine-protein kinase NCRK isoform X2 [Ipomoea triloba]|uniref:receptor-like serine/threonine-protein kinase NCRK isoform X2 n=1 Tax=Ipomoea triloba TaxID=35885 RepID=UPI00125DE013|nr:receptor-like serine/threonine-protein kinase NCRK isoform X2 [Ipomoea triloba]
MILIIKRPQGGKPAEVVHNLPAQNKKANKPFLLGVELVIMWLPSQQSDPLMMRFSMPNVLVFLICAAWTLQIRGEGPYNPSETNKWECACFNDSRRMIPANCSSSCDCNLEGFSESRWMCVCPADRLPLVAADERNDVGCFTSCTCRYGAVSEMHSPNKWIFSKGVFVALLLCSVLATLASVALMLFYIHRRNKYSIDPPKFSSEQETSFGCLFSVPRLFRSKVGTSYGTITRFSYLELETATGKFSCSNLIGVGGSSCVYRGELKDGRAVAVKKIKGEEGEPDRESSFLSEIELISRLHHCHVVPLLGYCSERHGKRSLRLLVFEYMPNGSLRDCLDGASGRRLEWNARVAIALGAARGLEYLHEAAAPRILHRDVKSTNILLDGNWRAKITDLGMAKCLQNDGVLSCPSSPARMHGTFGYIAPEYAIGERASLKSDVFSFGVVLLELITGRPPIQKSADKREESLVIWVAPHLQDSQQVSSGFADPNLQGEFEEDEMQVMAFLARECLLLDPHSRPSMSEIVQLLSTIAPHQKSKRKNFLGNSFKSSFIHDVGNDGRMEAEEIKQITSHIEPPCSSHDHYGQITEKVDAVDFSKCAERMILLTSSARSWHSQEDDEVVDLTEPRG